MHEKRTLRYMEWAAGDTMTQAFDCGGPNVGASTPYEGLDLNWGGTAYTVQGGTLVQNYSGYDINFGGTSLSNLANAANGLVYGGNNLTYGGSVNLALQATTHDPDPINTYPKNQTIYYKIAGFNTNTHQLEVWIISETVVTRPETFNPTGNPPNVDLSLYLTPPSGHTLVNVKIIARWIQ
jgi:hypothetical protein